MNNWTDLLTLEEAAQMAGIPPAKVADAVKVGRLRVAVYAPGWWGVAVPMDPPGHWRADPLKRNERGRLVWWLWNEEENTGVEACEAKASGFWYLRREEASRLFCGDGLVTVDWLCPTDGDKMHADDPEAFTCSAFEFWMQPHGDVDPVTDAPRRISRDDARFLRRDVEALTRTPALEYPAGVEPETKKLGRQQRAIIDAIRARGWDLFAIPNGGVKTLRLDCEEKYPELFDGGTSFENAWKSGNGKLWALANREAYANIQKSAK